MTPEQYQLVKRRFAEAIEQPEGLRQQFVEQLNEDPVVLTELETLLRHHIANESTDGVKDPDDPDQTVAWQATQPHIKSDQGIPATENDETVDFSRPASGRSSSQPNRLTPKVDDASGADHHLSKRFAKATRNLLQSRLIIMAGLILSMLVIATIFVTVSGEGGWKLISVRAVTILILSSLIYWLRSSEDIPLRHIRFAEIAIIGIPLAELMYLFWDRIQMADLGMMSTPSHLQAVMGWLVSIYIALYGIFIPSNWRRTAIFTSVMACCPVIVMLCNSDRFTSMDIASSCLMLSIMCGIATTGSFVVHQIRRQAERARSFGQYKLAEEIGRGSMGVVYRAEHQMLKRPAAIKLIRLEAASHVDAIQQFEQEVQISASLSHWNSVQIYDFGTSEGGEFFYVMELLHGESLQSRIQKAGKLTVRQTLEIVVQTCAALAEAHAKDFVHRDIKASNVFLADVGGAKDVVKVLDFGLAVSGTSEAAQKGICGTPSYMPPEQIRVETLDGRADIYAIGCLMFECLTGRLPFRAPTMTKLLSEHLFSSPNLDLLQDSGNSIQSIVGTCLEKRADDRYQSVDELSKACQEILRSLEN